MARQDDIDRFLQSPSYGVVGASANRSKYGNKVVRCYQMNGRNVIPVNPNEAEIEGIPCVAQVSGLPGDVKSISVITPPTVTEKVVAAAIAHGIHNIWLQPGAESQHAIDLCRDAGVNIIADGSCILVVLGYSEH